MRCWLQAEPARKLVNPSRFPVMILMSEASYHAGYDHCTARYLTQAVVKTDLVRMADHSLHGDGHMLMLEKQRPGGETDRDVAGGRKLLSAHAEFGITWTAIGTERPTTWRAGLSRQRRAVVATALGRPTDEDLRPPVGLDRRARRPGLRRLRQRPIGQPFPDQVSDVRDHGAGGTRIQFDTEAFQAPSTIAPRPARRHGAGGPRRISDRPDLAEVRLIGSGRTHNQNAV